MSTVASYSGKSGSPIVMIVNGLPPKHDVIANISGRQTQAVTAKFIKKFPEEVQQLQKLERQIRPLVDERNACGIDAVKLEYRRLHEELSDDIVNGRKTAEVHVPSMHDVENEFHARAQMLDLAIEKLCSRGDEPVQKLAKFLTDQLLAAADKLAEPEIKLHEEFGLPYKPSDPVLLVRQVARLAAENMNHKYDRTMGHASPISAVGLFIPDELLS